MLKDRENILNTLREKPPTRQAAFGGPPPVKSHSTTRLLHVRNRRVWPDEAETLLPDAVLDWKEAVMSKFQERAEAQTKQIIGQMLGDELLVQEGKEQQRDATEPSSPAGGKDQGIVRDERGQEQPKDKERAQRVSRVDKGGDPPGQKT
jgi:hypothetical protein